MTCQQKNCKEEATHTVYWPNQVTHQCFTHASKIQILGKAMGVEVPIVSIKTETENEI